ncbi:alpha/beta hydrolase family protein [Actinomadura spongiicola]|uniref:hypothetical protein n=1 Tax=Actinomadura spongiicola TaxID=2303421 RepID=UPI0011C180E1|nr:hypothetical protein [Actinomadura spongiicola]
MADTLAGLAHRTGTDVGVVRVDARSRATETLIVVFPGFIMPAAEVAQAFAPHLRANVGLLVVQYADRGVDPSRIHAALLPEINRLRPYNLVFYGASMGGMCAYDFLLRAKHELPGTPGLVLDTAPASVEDVRRPGWSFWLASRYRGGPLASGVWNALSRLPVSRPTPEVDADASLIVRSRSRSAKVGMPAITSQAAYIGGFRLRHTDLTGRIHYLRANPATQDPLIKVDQAIIHWRAVHPSLKVSSISSRRGDWHIPLVERPAETVAAILASSN